MRKIIVCLAALMLGSISSAVVAGAGAELEAFKQAIRSQYDLKERAFANDDPNTVVEQFYSEDVFSVDNEGHVHNGREELRKVYSEVVPPYSVKIESIKTAVDGNSGWDWANFFVTPDDPAEKPFSFIILFLWEKRAEKWWCVGDIYVVGKYPPDPEPAVSQ